MDRHVAALNANLTKYKGGEAVEHLDACSNDATETPASNKKDAPGEKTNKRPYTNAEKKAERKVVSEKKKQLIIDWLITRLVSRT